MRDFLPRWGWAGAFATAATSVLACRAWSGFWGSGSVQFLGFCFGLGSFGSRFFDLLSKPLHLVGPLLQLEVNGVVLGLRFGTQRLVVDGGDAAPRRRAASRGSAT